MNLFSIENGIVIPYPESLLIFPFSDIWARDLTTKRDIAVKEFTYVEFMCSYKKTNPYIGYPEDIRPQKIKSGIFKDYPEWEPDNLILEAINVYKDFQNQASPSIRFYEAAIKGIISLQKYYETLNMNAKTATGALVNKPSDVSRGLSQTASVLQNLETLKDKVQQELLESNRIRSNRVVNPFER
jgi:hypothetical protein